MDEGFWLAIETSAATASVAVGMAGEVWFREDFGSARSHNAALFGPLGRALGLLGKRRLAGVLVGTGPGSYGGTRVGIAAAQGVAVARACPAVGLPSLLGTPQARAGGRSRAAGDARRGGWWLAAVVVGRVAGAPAIFARGEFVDLLEKAMVAGEPVVAFDPVERFGLPAELAGRLAPAEPHAVRLLEAWWSWDESERARHAAEVPQPVYLRPPHITRASEGHPLLRDQAVRGPGD